MADRAVERKIPVFTVLKNDSVLKNIFLLDSPPSFSSDNGGGDSEMEEILMVGRHPDCHITLEHPSISRFHLRIHSNRLMQSLAVIDLFSVHGTWISGKKIEPGVRVELKEGDTMKLGGSSRAYRLHWIPFSHAYDYNNLFVPPSNNDNPFVPQWDSLDPVEETEGDTFQDENAWGQECDSTLVQDDNLEGLDLLFSDENTFVLKQQYSTLVPKEMNNPISHEEEAGSSISLGVDQDQCDLSGIQDSSQVVEGNSILKAPLTPLVSQKASQTENIENHQVMSEKKSGSSIWSRRGKPTSVKIRTARGSEKGARSNSDTEVKTWNLDMSLIQFDLIDSEENISASEKENCPHAKDQDDINNEIFMKSTLFGVEEDEEEIFTPDKENMTPNTLSVRSMKKMGKLKEVNCPKPYRSSPLKKAGGCYMQGQERDGALLEKENQVLEVLMEQKSMSSAFRSHSRELTVMNTKVDREPFQTLHLNSSIISKTKSKVSVHDASARSGKSINYLPSEDVTDPMHRTSREFDKRWTMVMDTACLLNKKSRKELQLLQGLKGTSIIIPRIVIRELDCMLRGSFFSRRKVSAALQWIEDCMKNANGWVHVQSSAEEGRLVAPTPPASPMSQFSREKGAFSFTSLSFSPHTLLDIVTPTAEDHILECALFFKRIRSGERLVLLSDDVTLKIKAMAEGLICETAGEFRESLVNPYSDRFMYTDSSPRGPTWSCEDDIVLREKYYPNHLKKRAKPGEGIKGLKLILLHNTNFKQMTSIR